MITHRKETAAAPEPAVQFYKIIAVSFLLVTIILLGVIIYITSKKASIVIVAKNDTKSITVSLKLGGNDPQALHGVVTSTLFHWSENFQPTGNKTVEGVATGEVMLINKTGANQTLVKTTRLVTPAGLLFHLSERVIVPAEGQIAATVYADRPGGSYEIATSTFTVPGLSPDKQKVIYAISAKPMVGGSSRVGVLSSEDLKNAENSYKENVIDAFLAQTSSSFPGFDEKIVAVAEENITPDHKAGEEVSAFTLSGTSTIIVVAYRGVEVNTRLEKAIADATNGTTEKFLAANKTPTISVANHSLKDGTAELSVTQEAVVTLDSNADSLSPEHFLGKKKDEIERYVLGLDHVAAVEVQFSPGWMLSAPSVPDRIKVVVKNVE